MNSSVAQSRFSPPSSAIALSNPGMDERGSFAAPAAAPSRNLQILQQMAEGSWDLTVRMGETGSSPAVARLFNQIFANFAEAITNSTRCGLKLYENVPQLFRFSEKLEEASKTQALHASQIANSAQQMAENLHAITGGVQQALDFTDQVGGIVRELETRSHQIEDVVGLVRRVASQTKLLSLNASVEAARAGEAGRAFGVVAEEVQRLAQEASEATDRIHDVLHSLEERIADAVRAVGQRSGAVVAAHHAKKGETTLTGLMEQAVARVKATDQEVVQVAQDIQRIVQEAQQQSEGATHLKTVAARAQEGSDALIVSLGVFRLPAHARPRELIGRIVEEDDMRGMTRPRQEAMMQQIVQQYRFVELLYVTDSNGQQVTNNIAGKDFTAAYGSSGYGKDWSQRPWYLEPVRSDSLYVSDIYRSAASDRFCFTISAPLHNDDGEIVGVLGADIDLSQLI